MVGEEGELVFAVRVVRLEGVPPEFYVFLLRLGLEGERQVVGELGGFFHGSSLRGAGLLFALRRAARLSNRVEG